MAVELCPVESLQLAGVRVRLVRYSRFPRRGRDPGIQAGYTRCLVFDETLIVVTAIPEEPGELLRVSVHALGERDGAETLARVLARFRTLLRRRDSSAYLVEEEVQRFSGGSAPAFVSTVCDIRERERAHLRVRNGALPID